MNNEPHDTDSVEVLLQRFRPAPPKEVFMQRLRSVCPVLTAVPDPKRMKVIVFPFLLARLAAIAAAVAAGLITWHLMQPPGEVPAVPAGTVTTRVDNGQQAPRKSTQRLMGVRDMGIARDEQRRPVRLMHATWIDDDVYLNAPGEEPVREARVREEIVPVVLNDF